MMTGRKLKKKKKNLPQQSFGSSVSMLERLDAVKS